MNKLDVKNAVQQILDDLSATLDVSPAKYEEARDHYEAVGAWLDAEDSPLRSCKPEVFPQGSFALGTVIRPLGEDDYDVDTVCRLRVPPSNVTQKQLKDLVGDRLKQHKTYMAMLDPEEGGRRCWTLRYEEKAKFHLDILPAVPDGHSDQIALGVPRLLAEHSIRITDKTTWDDANVWPKSNPAGYALWFKERMKIVLEQSKLARAREIKASVASIEDYQVRTPLQRAIQVLKRHRDLRWMGDADKPISIIITTLAAAAYQNESNPYDALVAIIPKMRQALETQKRSEEWWVANPVNPAENFADKWKETKRKADVFFEWLDTVEQEFKDLITESGFSRVGEYLTQSYGPREAAETMKRYASRGQSGIMIRQSAASSSLPAPLPLPVTALELTTFHPAHRRSLPWPLQLVGRVTLSAQWKRSVAWRPLHDGQTQVIAGSKLRFDARTSIAPPYEVFWQVVNTGKAARLAYGLRGEIFLSKEAASPLRNEEETQYRGRHWIECFIVRDGVCLARSGEFVVNVV